MKSLITGIALTLMTLSPAHAVMCSVANPGQLCALDAPGQKAPVELYQGLVYKEWECIHFWNHKPQQTDDVIHTCKVPEERYDAAMDLIIGDYRHMGGDGNSSAGIWVENHCHAEPAIPHNKWVCEEESVHREWR